MPVRREKETILEKYANQGVQGKMYKYKPIASIEALSKRKVKKPSRSRSRIEPNRDSQQKCRKQKDTHREDVKKIK